MRCPGAHCRVPPSPLRSVAMGANPVLVGAPFGGAPGFVPVPVFVPGAALLPGGTTGSAEGVRGEAEAIGGGVSVVVSVVVAELADVVAVTGGAGGSSVVAAGAAGLVASQTPPPPSPTKSKAPTTKSAMGVFRAGAVFKRAPVMSVPENPPVAAPIAPPGKPEMRPSVGA